MSKSGKRHKSLIVGIVGAVVVLAVLLTVLLTQCMGQEPAATAPTVEPTEQTQPGTYTLYWNLDRVQYDGKSEAGMSGRMPESDGYFHIRLFCDGEELTVKTADRRVVNKLDTMSLFGLVFDEDGFAVDVLSLDQLPLERIGWGFYVQSVGGKTVKLNSSDTLEGMEVLVEGDSDTRFYDMTGASGPVGNVDMPTAMDRVYTIADLNGNVTHMFIYDRTHYMKYHEAYCQHCEQNVQWGEWTRTDTIPSKTGHYQMMTDVKDVKQVSYKADTKICLDLNGHEIHGAKDSRIISLHNAGCALAIMDTSEGQTGKLVGHSEASPQGGVVWVRYGQFHLYSGTLDGSDMISRLNGTVVQVPKNAFFYMHGGTILGGTAAPQRSENGKYTYGLGGSVQVTGTMRMYGGTIRGGKSPAVYYTDAKGKLAIARGMGGNIFLASGSVMEMTGGSVLYGYAGNVGGNIMMDGTAELTLSGGTIAGGWTDARVANKHGGNIYVGGKSVIRMSGGSIDGGVNKTAAGGNLNLSGTLIMTGGLIRGGWAKTSGGNIHVGGNGKLTVYAGTIRDGYAESNAGNINVSSTATMTMSGGTVSGGVAGGSGGNIAINTKGVLNLKGGVIKNGTAKGGSAGNGGGNIAMVAADVKLIMTGGTLEGGISQGAISGGTLAGGDGGNLNMNRGTAVITGGTITGGQAQGNAGGIYVGWNAISLELGGKAKIYGNEKTDMVRSGNSAKGKSQIILNGWEGNGEAGPLVIDRMAGVAGSVLVVPAEGATLTETQKAMFVSNRRALPVDLAGGNLILSKTATLGEADHTHCLCAGGMTHTCADTGFVTLTAEEFYECWTASNGKNYLLGSLNICLGEDVTVDTECAMNGAQLNLCLNGHTLTLVGNARLTANGGTGVLNITDCGDGKILAAEGCATSFLYTYKGKIQLYAGTVDGSACATGMGAVRVGYDGDTFNMYGGTIVGNKKASIGGAICVDHAGTVNLMGGTVRDGVASAGGGGNIHVNAAGAVVNISGATVSGGQATSTKVGSGLGGNIHVVKGSLNISGGTITDGEAKGITAEGEPAGVTGGIYLAYNAGKTTLSGDARIYGNTGSDVWLTSKAGYLLNIENWNGNGAGVPLVIGKTAGSAGSVLVGDGVTKEDAALFAPGNEGMVIKRLGGKLMLATPFDHSHCICQGTLDHGHADAQFLEISTAEEFAKLFDSNGKLAESVDIALNGSFTLESEYVTNGNVLSICLNGNTITMKGKARLKADAGTLNITDCGTKGSITAAEGCQQSFIYTNGGKLNIFGGTLDASAIDQTVKKSGGTSGGAVTVFGAGDEAHMYGGTIVGGTLYRGGGLYVYNGTFTLHGGTIRDGKANVGGNVATDYGTFNMLGGEVTGGRVEDDGTNACNGAAIFLGYNSKTAMTLSGDAKIYGNEGAADIWCGQKPANNVNYLIVDGWNGNGSHGPVSLNRQQAAAGAVIAQAKEGQLTDADLQGFTYYGEDLRLKLSEGKIVLAGYHKHCICNGKVEGHTCTDVKFLDVETAEQFTALFTYNTDKKVYYLNESANIVLTGSFTLTQEYATGGLVLNICLNGNTITMQSSAEATARLTANGGAGALNITDCTGTGKIVSANTDTSAFVYAQDTAVNLYGGTLDASAVVREMVSGTGNGAAVHVNTAAATFHMYGGTIRGGQLYRGGAVYTHQGTIYIHGGTVRGGRANVGGNVAVNQGRFFMDGGIITGGYANGNGAGVHMGYGAAEPMVLSGKAAIYGNEGPEDLYLGYKTAATNVLLVDGWAGNQGNAPIVLGSRNAAVGAVMVQAKTGSLTGTLLKDFAYPGDVLQLALSEGKFVLEEILYHKHCLCDGKVEGHSCKDVIFQEIGGANDFNALFTLDANGKYQLKQSASVCLNVSFTLGAEYHMNGHTLDLCLNGQQLTMMDKAKLYADGNGTLNITDCGNGKIKANGANDCSMLYAKGGDINVYAGTMDASAVKCSLASDTSSNYGGLGYAYNAGDTFTVYGGTLIGGQVPRGGVLFAQAGTIVIRGGTLTGGKAVIGGGVSLNNGASFEMTGGTITGNTAEGHSSNSVASAGAGVQLGYNIKTKPVIGGNAAIYGNIGHADVYLGHKDDANRCIILDGWTGCGEGKTMTLWKNGAADGGVLAALTTGSVTETQLGFLAAYDADYGLILNGEGKVALKKLHRHCLCNGAVSGVESHTCQKLVYTEVSADQFNALFELSSGKYLLKENATVCLTENVTLDAEYATNGYNLDLCLNGNTVTVGANGRLTKNKATGALNISDCGSGTIKAPSNAKTRFIYVYDGILNFYGGTVDASAVSSTTAEGVAVYVDQTTATFNMYGGTVKAPAKAKYGGAVYVNNGKVNIYGGTVNGGAATYGGAVYLKAGDIEIFGGTIYGAATDRGGAVFAQDATAEFIMHGGLISGGSAQYGGCVGCNKAQFRMDGGTITGGTATISGAGVNIHYSVTVPPVISGTAVITGNTGFADIHLGQNKSNNKQYLVLDPAWAGNGEKPLVISKNDPANNAVIIVPTEGKTLTDTVLGHVKYLTDDYTPTVADGKVVMNAK